ARFLSRASSGYQPESLLSVQFPTFDSSQAGTIYPRGWECGAFVLRIDHAALPVELPQSEVRGQKDYIPEAFGSFLNEFRTASRNNIGSRSPPLAHSSICLATMLTAGSLRSARPKARKTSSKAVVMTEISSGEKAPFEDKRG